MADSMVNQILREQTDKVISLDRDRMTAAAYRKEILELLEQTAVRLLSLALNTKD